MDAETSFLLIENAYLLLVSGATYLAQRVRSCDNKLALSKFDGKLCSWRRVVDNNYFFGNGIAKFRGWAILNPMKLQRLCDVPR